MEATQKPEILVAGEAEPISTSKTMDQPADDASATEASSRGSDSGVEDVVEEDGENKDAEKKEPEEVPGGQKEEGQGNEGAKKEAGGLDDLAQLLAGAVASAVEKETEGEGGAEVAESGLNGLLQLLAANSHSNGEDGEGPMLRATKAGLDELDLNYEVQPPDASRASRIIHFGLTCKVGLSKVIIAVDEGEKKFLFYIKAPGSVPETKRTEAALFFTWINYGLSIGNFELDLSDGEVRFKSSNHLLSTELSSEMVSHTVALAVKMIDQFFPGVMAVVYGGKDPKQAHDDCMADGRVQSAQ